ncbi:LysE family transporter [Aliiglaciecola sp. CAU 1673]|uniref:LysE family translocator n=1 Tax=Aliiglaciecola sp. CAU 1673 TaxID=3032595 RepID=UPI0023DC4361|nr:LysE family transporter [Aliiglaciecola sp. CAU 1673]MDF2177958.1 LysE family transporter [Aliiglaciecola sp. CAU 1673]
MQSLSSVLLPLTLFTLTAVSTPGPNNTLLSANGARFGMRASLPFVLGIRLGNFLMVCLLALGLGGLLISFPQIQWILKLVAIAYLLFLACKIATLPPPGVVTAEAVPLGFWQGASFQFINPKAWMTGMTCLSAFTLSGEGYVWSVVQVILVWALIGLLGSLLWVQSGVLMARLLKTSRHWRIYNCGLAGATLASIILVIK